MLRASRKTAYLVLAGLALVAAGCGSNNKGKIEGKWKITEFPSEPNSNTKDTFADLGKMGLYIAMEFKSDESLVMALAADKPETLEFVKLMSQGKPTSWNAKYKLESGDGVEFYDLPKDMQNKGGGGLFGSKDRAKVKIKIDGDNMTMTDDTSKVIKLVRVK
ncbi:MAG TPA: hypothetical protein VHR66_00800 [Gemmataceae bacterium]|jgi:hypothetical protein|nr:hypothetical protein [Gemmataceae bacterium]